MEKLPDAFKATVAVFHGIISTWLDEFYFVILIIFFSVANILVWRLVSAMLVLEP